MQILVFVFFVNIILNVIFMFIHPNELKEGIFQHALLGPLFSSLFGLIPNCATSVISAQLYADGTLLDGTFLSAILTNAGVGLIVLFHVNRNLKQNIKIVFFLFITALLSGIAFNLTDITF